VRHVVFKNYEAPLDFVSLGALDRYFNRVCLPDRVRVAARVPRSLHAPPNHRLCSGICCTLIWSRRGYMLA